MPNASLEDRNFAIACYLISLALGETINWQHIAATTVKEYFRAYELLFKGRTVTTPDGKEDKIPYRFEKDYVSLILTALDKYEGVKDRCNMITDRMMHLLYKHSKKHPTNSLPQALFDWIVVGRYNGARRAEWCQRTQTKFQTIRETMPSWPTEEAQAFLIEDFVFLDSHGKILSARNTRRGRLVHYVIIKWRYQKNMDHGQEITYARDRKNATFCPVEALVRIICRAHDLDVPKDHPIAVYEHEDGRRLFITDTDVADILRTTASEAHNIPAEDPELKKWSSHSIRVTACNLLHRQMFSDSYIKNRLRWKSNCFQMYLRNTFYTADQHTIPLSENNLPQPEGVVTHRQNEAHEIIMTQV